MKTLLIACFLLLAAVQASAQDSKARLVDEFSILPCGDIMGRLDIFLTEWRRDPAQQIVVIYYGHRYRKSLERRKNGSEVVRLNHAHPDDGLNWAAGIPKYLLARYEEAWDGDASLLKQRIRLIDGGYREKIFAEMWIVRAGAADPKPTPTIARGDIKFGAKQPRRVPDYYDCYSAY